MKLNGKVLLIFGAMVGILVAGIQTAHAAPPVTTGLKLWLDAGNINGLNNAGISNGDLIGSWTNLAPGSADAVTGSGSARPTFVTNAVSGNPAVRFNGTSNVLTDPAPSLNITGFGLTLFVVLKESATPTDGYLGNYGGANTGYYLNENATDRFLFFAGGGPTFVSSAAGTASGTHNKALLLSGLHDVSAMSLYTNGFLAATGASSAITSSGLDFGIGNDGRGDGFWGADYSEVLIYNRALSASEFQEVTEYFFAEYSIPEPSVVGLAGIAMTLLFWRRR